MDKKFIYKQIGKNIAKFRQKKGYTQESLAELMDKSWSSIAKMETCGKNITIGKLIDIAQYLEIDFREFLKW